MPGASALPAGAWSPTARSKDPNAADHAAGCSRNGAEGWGSPLALPSFSGDSCNAHSAGDAAHASLLQFHPASNGSFIGQLNCGNTFSSCDWACLFELGAGGGRGLQASTLIALFLILSCAVVIVQCFTGSDVLRW
ncbi:uncharacterized protein [Lolium perenne]|uniref:uncharacterized protein isoform X2 n=1 Tax=Lolium perenne TaxID=4522 RepID=UPI0021F6894F|nr:uncharacterized protein LOC127294421 isoform X2 [Lolium perenne]